ncbi:hypothetical protein N9L76_02670 [bacterium]|nr:hypothetical protein [bacterium]MDC1215581.1 hypothetical protein [bacterium]
MSPEDNGTSIESEATGSANAGAVVNGAIEESDNTPAAIVVASATLVRRPTVPTSTPRSSASASERGAQRVDVDGGPAVEWDVEATRRGVSVSRIHAAARGAYRTDPAVTSVCASIME